MLTSLQVVISMSALLVIIDSYLISCKLLQLVQLNQLPSAIAFYNL